MGWFGNLHRRRREQSELDEALWRRAIAPYAFITALDPPDLLRLREMVTAFLDQKQLSNLLAIPKYNL